MATSAKPQKLQFNNVISMGVSYSWENMAGGSSPFPCSGVNQQDGSSLIKRTKNVSLDVLNLDLSDTAQVVEMMAENQSKYVTPDLVDIYANDIYAGKGKLSNYSIKEGSQSNAIVTNLGYQMINGGPDDEEGVDKEENPVSRDESITVSRDIKSKSYTIEHSYSINFGNDFNLVSDHPLYSDNPSYKSVDARLALGENEANQKFLNPIDYNQYIDLSGYALGTGWNLEMLSNNCMGSSQTSSETKDYINGNYSKTLTRQISYTGENIDEQDTDPYEIEYTMSFNTETRENKTCAIAKLEGTVRSTSSIYNNCGQATDNSAAAQSGFDAFVTQGVAKSRLTSWFNSLSSLAGSSSSLNPVMKNLTKSQCLPSVDRGDNKNNGEIKFSFEMNNCPDQKQASNNSPYTESETTSSSFSKGKDCDNKEVQITNSTVNKSIQGSCGAQIDSNGNYPRFDSISSVNGPSNPPYEGSRSADNKIQSESYSYSPYQASKSWSITFSDALKDQDCNNRGNPCDKFTVTTNEKPKTPRYAEAVTCNGIITEQKGFNSPYKSASVRLESGKDSCKPLSLEQTIQSLQIKLQANAPSCVIQNLSWSYSKSSSSKPSAQGSIGGINS